jgi:hypothetical protein
MEALMTTMKIVAEELVKKWADLNILYLFIMESTPTTFTFFLLLLSSP